MTLVSTQEMLQRAQRERYAVAGFAAYNLETLKALVATADALQAPVMIQITPSNVANIGVDYLSAIAKIAAEQTHVPVALHLDHGDSVELVQTCLKHGFTSVMIDGSALPYEENICVTREAVRLAHAQGASVEAELGRLGGVEDDLHVEASSAFYTDPAQAKDFVKRTGIDSLAIAIGTAHGLYQGEPKLDLDRLSKIASLVSIPLVLHGASGLPDRTVQEAVRRGICKINIATELKIPFAQTLRGYLVENLDESDPRKLFKSAVSAYASVIEAKIRLVEANDRYQ